MPNGRSGLLPGRREERVTRSEPTGKVLVNHVKDPDDWKTKDDGPTTSQHSTYTTLVAAQGLRPRPIEDFTKASISKEIDRLRDLADLGNTTSS